MFGFASKTIMVEKSQALPGRNNYIYNIPEKHDVLGSSLRGPWTDKAEVVYFAMGCFWGAERLFWETPGVISTAAGYMGGFTPYPTYQETTTARTGHTETVQVVYDPDVISFEKLVSIFWEEHDPTQFMGQGNDRGTEYRSALYYTTERQEEIINQTRETFQQRLHEAKLGDITTEIKNKDDVGEFYYAEDYHQQYLAKNPSGYCGLQGTGVTCPIPLLKESN